MPSITASEVGHQYQEITTNVMTAIKFSHHWLNWGITPMTLLGIRKNDV